MLTLTPGGAKTVLYLSEGRDPGHGHTLSRHVNISREALRARNDEPGRGDIACKCAFRDIHQCCNLLPDVITHMQALGDQQKNFVQNFENLPNGALIQASRVRLPITVPVRYSNGDTRGIPTDTFYLAAAKIYDRPFQLHIITFYPQILID